MATVGNVPESEQDMSMRRCASTRKAQCMSLTKKGFCLCILQYHALKNISGEGRSAAAAGRSPGGCYLHGTHRLGSIQVKVRKPETSPSRRPRADKQQATSSLCNCRPGDTATVLQYTIHALAAP